MSMKMNPNIGMQCPDSYGVFGTKFLEATSATDTSKNDPFVLEKQPLHVQSPWHQEAQLTQLSCGDWTKIAFHFWCHKCPTLQPYNFWRSRLIFLAHLPIPMAREGSPVTGAVAIPRIPAMAAQTLFGAQIGKIIIANKKYIYRSLATTK